MRKRILAFVLSAIMIIGCFGAVSVSAADYEMSFDKAYSMMNKMFDYLVKQTPQDRDYLFDWVHSYMKTDLGVDAMITLVDDQSAAGNNTVVKNFIYSFGVTDSEKNDLKFALNLAKCIPVSARDKAFGDMKERVKFASELTNEQSQAIDSVYKHFLSAEYQNVLNADEHKIEKMVIMQFLADLNKTFVITDGNENKSDFELYKLNSEFKSKIESGELKSKYPVVNNTDWQNAEQLIKIFINSTNTSEMFNESMKDNFKTVLGIGDVGMYVKREFDVSVSGNAVQVESNTKNVEFTASSNIDSDDLKNVKWYVNNKLEGSGKNFTYNPSELKAGENAVVKAVFGAYEKENKISVVSAPDYTLDITVSGDAEQYAGAEKEVMFTASVTPKDSADTSDTLWYVNSVLQSQKGGTFKFTPSGEGEYSIKAVLNGAESSAKKIVVKSFKLSLLYEGKLSQNVSETSAVKFTAKTTNSKPTDNIKWYVNEKIQPQTGENFNFVPEAGKAEVYVIYAELDGCKTEEKTVVVCEEAIKIFAEDESLLKQRTGKLKTVTIKTDEDNTKLTAEQITTLKWYVNGIVQSQTGDMFDFKPTGVGEYKIVAKFGNGAIVSNEIMVKVTASVSGRDDSSSTKPGGITVVDKKELEDIIAPTQTAVVKEFADLNGHWAEVYMQYLYNKGILTGTSDSTMSPDEGITRQEVAVLLTNLFGYSNEMPSGTVKYADDEKIAQWAKNAVYILSDRGIYAGYGDGSFKPENIISRQELVSLIGRHLSGGNLKPIDYADKNSIYYWAVDDVTELSSYGIVNGYPDNTFRPENSITRAEAAVIIYNTMYRMGMCD